jgi:adenylosuccinate synthase
MLIIFTIANNTKAIYTCIALLVVILGNMYLINCRISENLYKGHEFDTSTETESDSDFEIENAASILQEFKKVINDADEADDSEQLVTETNSYSPAEYDRIAREYTEIEQIIQNVAAEYRKKAVAAREAAMAAHDVDAEARANAADEREYNEDQANLVRIHLTTLIIFTLLS